MIDRSVDLHIEIEMQIEILWGGQKHFSLEQLEMAITEQLPRTPFFPKNVLKPHK